MNIFSQLARRNFSTATAVAHVRLWHFVASIEEAVTPKLRTIPFAVVDGLGPTSRVIDANDLARSFGVRIGQTITVAKRRSPQLLLRSWDPQRIEGFRHAFKKLTKQWGRVLSIAGDGQGATLAIPAVNALERAAIFLHIQQACWTELECNVVVGVGPTAAFALLAAHSCAEPGFRYLDRWEETTLRTVPVACIPHIGRRTSRALVHLGVPTTWHFLQLNPDTILAQGGPSLLQLYRQYIPDAQLLPSAASTPEKQAVSFLPHYAPLPTTAL